MYDRTLVSYRRQLTVIVGGIATTGFPEIVALGHAVKIFLTVVVARILDVGDINFKLLKIKDECIATRK